MSTMPGKEKNSGVSLGIRRDDVPQPAELVQPLAGRLAGTGVGDVIIQRHPLVRGLHLPVGPGKRTEIGGVQSGGDLDRRSIEERPYPDASPGAGALVPGIDGEIVQGYPLSVD